MNMKNAMPARRWNATRAHFESRIGGAKSVLSYHKNLSPIVAAIGQIHVEGNIIPHRWYSHARLRTDAGTLHFTAMHLLANLLYWYRPVIERDEYTQEIRSVRNKFAGDKLRVDYAEWAKFLGMTKRQVQDAVAFLVGRGLIEREIRDNYQLGNVTIYNAVFLAPVPAAIVEITDVTAALAEGGIPFRRDTPPADDENGGGGTVKRDTPHVEAVHPPTPERDTPHVETCFLSENTRETSSDISKETTTNTTPAASANSVPVETERVVACDEDKNDSMESVRFAIAESFTSGDVSLNDGKEQTLESRLIEVGIKSNVAHRLAIEHAEEAARQLEYLPFRNAKDRAAILVQSINQTWEAPDAYTNAQKAKAKREQDACDRVAEEAYAASEVAKVHRERAERLAAAEMEAVSKAQRDAEHAVALANLSPDQKARLESVAWQEMARTRGPIGSWAVRVLDGQTSADSALSNRMVRLEYDRILLHLVADASAKGGSR